MASIGPGMKAAILETFHSAVSLIPEDLRGGFVLVGGAALLMIGGNRKTEDIDFAVTAPALHAFFEAAANDSRFKKGPSDNWEYQSSNDLIVPIEFLSQGGGFAPFIRVTNEVGSNGGVRAGLGELALMKAKTWLGRGEEKDLKDFRFLLTKMEKEGENFKDMVLVPASEDEELGDVKVLTTVGKDAGQHYSTLLQNML